MNNTVSTTSRTDDNQSSLEHRFEKLKDRFTLNHSYARVHWSNGRSVRHSMFESDALQKFAGYDDECRDVFTFDDPTSPLLNEHVSLLWFKNWKPSASTGIEKVSEKSSVKRRDNAIIAGGSFAPSTAITGITALCFHLNNITGPDFFGSILLVFLVTAFIGWIISYLIVDVKSEKIEDARRKALTVPQPNVGMDDELYVFAAFSNVPELAKRSNEATILMRDKIRSNPSADTLKEWTEMVEEFFKLQKNYPADLIPLNNEDTREALDTLKAKVLELREELLAKKALDDAAAAHGRLVSGAEVVDKENSTAVLAGSQAFIKSLSIADVE